MKKILLFLSTALFLITSGYSQGTWTWQNPLPQASELNFVKFTDFNNGYAFGWGGTILKSTDAGSTWNVQPSGTFNHLYSTHFTDLNNAYAVGAYGTIIKTANAGASWTTLTSGVTNFLYSVYFVNADTGYVVGSLGKILKTIDAGVSWTNIPSGTTNDLTSIYFVSTNIGFIVGMGGTVFKTTDGGLNWTSQISGTTNNLQSVYFTSIDSGFVVGLYGTLIQTINGGTTWFPKASGTSSNLNSVRFRNANVGMAVGNSGKVIETFDGGTTWLLSTTSPPAARLNSICFTTTGNNFIVGSGGIILSGLSSVILGNTMTLNKVHFTNINTGYAAGGIGTIHKTTDGGNTWVEMSSGLSSAFYSIYFTDANTGYFAGSSKIVKTIDAGLNFTTITAGISTSVGLSSIVFTDANNGYVVGNDGGGYAVGYKTTNAGLSWTPMPLVLFYGPLRQIVFINATTGFIVGDGIMLKTIDAGVTWSALSGLPSSYYNRSIFFTDANTGYIATSTGTILKTTDAGLTWTAYPVGTSYDNFLSISFSDSNNGYAAGWDGVFCKTNNAGATWTMEPPITSSHIYGLHFPSPYVGYAVGGGGSILKYNTSIVTTTSDLIDNREINIFPNPSSGLFTITNKDDKRKLKNGSLEIYNVVSQKIFSLDNVSFDNLEVDLSNQPNGIYFVKIKTDKTSISKKIILNH